LEEKMQISSNNNKGDSIENAITGVSLEHGYLDEMNSTLEANLSFIDQNLLIENVRQFDRFVVTMDDGSERILYFEISPFFGKI
jgi:uncharacterized membrane-anchored protein YitT (DUF2179 family)